MSITCNTNQNACCEQAAQAGDAPAREVFRPDVDIIETESGFTALADLPGVREEDVDVRFEDGTLTITARVGERWHEEREGRRTLVREYGLGDFERSFRLGEGIDVDKISAELRNGVLTLQLPKAERVRPRKIQVRTN